MAVIKIDPMGPRAALLREFPMTMQELIDLEGSCAAARLHLEGGDIPKQGLKLRTVPSLLESWLKDDGTEIEWASPVLKADAEIRDHKTRTKPKTISEFFDQFGINFEGEVAALVREHAPVKSVNALRGHVAVLGTQHELTTRATNPSGKSDQEAVSPEEIGALVDRIASNTDRSAARVSLRLLEECVELCLASGASGREIMASLSDALYNQALKVTATSTVTVFPSQLLCSSDKAEMSKELADVRLVMADLMYVSTVDEASVTKEERAKFRKLTDPTAEFATDGHTFYLRKSHIKDGTPST